MTKGSTECLFIKVGCIEETCYLIVFPLSGKRELDLLVEFIETKEFELYEYEDEEIEEEEDAEFEESQDEGKVIKDEL